MRALQKSREKIVACFRRRAGKESDTRLLPRWRAEKGDCALDLSLVTLHVYRVEVYTWYHHARTPLQSVERKGISSAQFMCSPYFRMGPSAPFLVTEGWPPQVWTAVTQLSKSHVRTSSLFMTTQQALKKKSSFEPSGILVGLTKQSFKTIIPSKCRRPYRLVFLVWSCIFCKGAMLLSRLRWGWLHSLSLWKWELVLLPFHSHERCLIWKRPWLLLNIISSYFILDYYVD